LNHGELDVCDQPSVDGAISSFKPELVINTAGFHRVDACEDDIPKAFLVNAAGPAHLAASCDKHGATLVHFSTDYVFDGRKGTPYVETDETGPLNTYGISKVAGEMAVAISCGRHYIVRTSGLFGLPIGPKTAGNFIDTMLRMAGEGKPVTVVDDQWFSPTSTRALAAQVRWLVGDGDYGTWHLTCQGECTWHGLAAAVFQASGLDADLRPTTTEAFGGKAKRPAYTVLASNKLPKSQVARLPHWQDEVEQYVRRWSEGA
jgi:dTDP-4-dehydrorhamnose reductase